MRKLYFVFAILLVASMVVSACGSPTSQASQSDSDESVSHYEPEGPTVHFSKVGGTVNVSLSHYVGKNPSQVTVAMIGEKDSETEGLAIDFVWTQTEMYKPELFKKFENLCSYSWTAVIDGKKAITQHIEEFDGACWVEFVFLPE